MSESKKYQYVYGPVPSRRFGRSLGIDLVPAKTCSYDCIFCQLGKTPARTVARCTYVPVDAVFAEIEDWLSAGGVADCITLSGSGEPTLHAEFGRVLRFLKRVAMPSVLLTNGSMLRLPEVREAASGADIVKVSLSAWDQSSFNWMNRPHPQIRFDDLIEGYKAFRDGFSGELWMEVFILLGLNSMAANVRKIADLAREIRPDRVQINTVARPPAEEFAAAPKRERLEELAGLFDPPAEVIAEFHKDLPEQIRATEMTILSMLRRRPCTNRQISEVFGLHTTEVSKHLGDLMRTGQIRESRKNGTVFYTAAGVNPMEGVRP